MKHQKWLAGTLAALLLVSLTGCGNLAGTKSESSTASPSASQAVSSAASKAEPDPAKPEGAAQLALDAVKELEVSSIPAYIALDNTAAVSSEMLKKAVDWMEGSNGDLMKAVVQNLSVETVGEAQQQDGVTTVQAKIVNTDLSGLAGKMAVWVLQNGTDDTNAVVQELTRLVQAADPTKTHTAEVTLHLEERDGAWKVVPDEALLNALAGDVLGSLGGSASALVDMFGGLK